MTITVTRDAARQVLDLRLPTGNDAEATTVRDYLIKLLALVWEQGECFNGKRPFGNSGWQFTDLYTHLITAGLVRGTLDEYGYVDTMDDFYAHALVAAAIRELGAAPEVPA